MASSSSAESAEQRLPFGLLPLLAGLAALLPASLDGLSPALPGLAAGFDTPAATTQAAMSFFVLSFALGQLFYGMVADRYGRRPVILAGLALYSAASLLATAAPSMPVLLAARALQGAGAAAAVLLGRTVVRDILEREAAARALALIGAIFGTVPVLAPLAGGALVATVGWRGPLAAMAVCGLLLLLLCGRRLPETLRERDAAALSWGGLAQASGKLFGSRAFLSYVFSCAFAYCGILLFSAAAPLVIIARMGVSAAGYAALFALSTTGFVAGNLIGRRYVSRRGVDQTLCMGAVMMAIAGIAMFVLISVTPGDWRMLVLPQMLYTCGWGIAQPQMQAGALSIFPMLAGRASALLGFVQLTLGGLAVGIFARWGLGNAPALAAAIATCGICALLAFGLLSHHWRVVSKST